jgi:hypothetical protein
VKLALRSEVGAAVAVSGPVEMAFDLSTVSTWPNGMAGIMGNSLRDKPFADAQETATELGRFRLSALGLLNDSGPNPTPLLVANGANDPYVPAVDTTMFEDRPNTVVRLEPHATHCAAEKSSIGFLSGVWLCQPYGGAGRPDMGGPPPFWGGGYLFWVGVDPVTLPGA